MLADFEFNLPPYDHCLTRGSRILTLEKLTSKEIYDFIIFKGVKFVKVVKFLNFIFFSILIWKNYSKVSILTERMRSLPHIIHKIHKCILFNTKS